MGLALLGGLPAVRGLRPRARRAQPHASSCWRTTCSAARRARRSMRCSTSHRWSCSTIALHATAQRAAVALPAATFAEGSGTLVSSEGRAQRYFRAFADAPVRDSWAWIGEIAAARRHRRAQSVADSRRRHRGLCCRASAAASDRRCRAARIVPRLRAEDSAPAAALQRAHRDARRDQRPRAPAACGSRLGARVLDGGRPGRAAGRAGHPLPGAGLELVSGRQQVPAGGSRCAARRACGKAPVRARRGRAGGISQRHSRTVRGAARRTAAAAAPAASSAARSRACARRRWPSERGTRRC